MAARRHRSAPPHSYRHLTRNLPSTHLAPDAANFVVDRATEPREVCALTVPAGRRLRVTVTATSAGYTSALGDPGALTAASDDYGVVMAAPGAENLIGQPGMPDGTFLCNLKNPCTKDLAIAADGTYTLVVGSDYGAGLRYTLEATAR